MKCFSTILAFSFLPFLAKAQQAAVYIAPGERLQVNPGENFSVYGNMVNNGALGSGNNASIYFFGKSWSNGAGASLPDESVNGITGKGGMFRFYGNNPLYGNQGSQQVFGGYNAVSRLGATFPNIDINNPLGLIMSDLTDLKIRNTLNFTAGHLFLNGWNLVIGNGNPGQITGYSEQAFIVTGTAIAGGFLFREQVKGADGKVVFPIGSSPAGYAPFQIEYSGPADDFRARVFDSVYQYAISGLVNKLDFTNKTWNIARGRTDESDTRLTIQHMDADEGREYSAWRSSSYVSRYLNNAWDNVEPESFPTAGNITTTGTLRNATMHVRRFNKGIRNNEYFTKASILYGPYAPAVFIVFNAYRINESLVQLEWSVARELNNEKFIIERRLDKDTGFVKVGEVFSMAPNGNSTTRLDYKYVDPNGHDGWSYYRIRAVSRNGGRESVTEIREVPPFLRLDVFPNPNFGNFQVRVRGLQSKLLMQIVSSVGQVMEQYHIEGERTIYVNNLAKGTYVLVFYDRQTGRLVRTFKIVVLER
ncbi:T9SS type A sorting domain-containing protein [Chitinophaga caseinilytica]|uniref:T9SS type A sorting domain-containing protein n=1 Tax=Chitinophaga caseinilytica TaxID=2267521 RepID=A0ABZ2Z9S9_9BACT